MGRKDPSVFDSSGSKGGRPRVFLGSWGEKVMLTGFTGFFRINLVNPETSCPSCLTTSREPLQYVAFIRAAGAADDVDKIFLK